MDLDRVIRDARNGFLTVDQVREILEKANHQVMELTDVWIMMMANSKAPSDTIDRGGAFRNDHA